MLSNPAEARQRDVRAGPCAKARGDCCDDGTQFRKVLVVKTAAANQLPNAFNRIEFRAVRWQEVKDKVVGNFLTPRFMQTGVVIASVVDDHDDLSSRGLCDASHSSIKLPASAGVKHPVRRRHDELAILQTHRPKVTDALTSWGVKANRVLDLRGNPHATSGAVLLEMHFIHSPQVNARIPCQGAEFFYARLAIQGQLWRLGGAVFVAGNPTAERVAGIAGPSIERRAHGEDTPIAWARPTSGSQGQPGLERTARRPGLGSIDVRSNGWDVPNAVPRTNPPVRGFRNVGPSSRHCEASHRAIEQLSGRSGLGPRGVLRGVDDRNAKRHCAESHPGVP